MGLFGDLFGPGSGGTTDAIPPTVSLVTPTSGTSVGPLDPVTFRVEDETKIALVFGWVRYADDPVDQIVYDGTSFHGDFVAISTADKDDPDDPKIIDFTLLPDDGWGGAIEALQFIVVDTGGNVVTATMSWLLDVEAPTEEGPESTATPPLVYTIHTRVSPAPRQVAPADRLRSLGRDKKWLGDKEVGPDGDYVKVEGDAALRQAIYLCLITEPGQYKYRPLYGCGLLRYLGKPATPALKKEIEARLRAGLQRLRRIEAVTHVAIEMTTPDCMKVHLQVQAAGRPVTLDPLTLRRPNT